MEGKQKAEAKAERLEAKFATASDAVRASNQGVREAKMMWSKAEREAKEYVSAIEAQHEKELAALVARVNTIAAELGVSLHLTHFGVSILMFLTACLCISVHQVSAIRAVTTINLEHATEKEQEKAMRAKDK